MSLLIGAPGSGRRIQKRVIQPVPLYEDVVIDDGAVLYFPLGETSQGGGAEELVNGDDGTYDDASGDSFIFDTYDGLPGASAAKSVFFEELARVTAPEQSYFRFGNSDPFTVEMWVKSPGSAFSFNQTFGLCGHEIGNDGWAWLKQQADGGIRFLTNNGNIQTNTINTFDADTWYLLHTVYNGAGNVQWYIDASANNDGNPSYQGAAPVGTADLRIGIREGAGAPSGSALIVAHFAIYNFEMDQTMAQAHYNKGLDL